MDKYERKERDDKHDGDKDKDKDKDKVRGGIRDFKSDKANKAKGQDDWLGRGIKKKGRGAGLLLHLHPVA